MISRVQQILAQAVSPNGKLLVTGNNLGAAQLWNTGTHRVIGPPLDSGDGPVLAVAFSQDGRTLATGSFDGTSRLLGCGNTAAGRRPPRL